MDPFTLVDFAKIDDLKKVTESPVDSKFRKFAMDLDKGTVKAEELMSVPNGNLDLPMYNQKYDGVKSCFTYLTAMWGPTVIDSEYAFPIHKYDSCQGKVVGTWQAATTVVQEANFVANPSGTAEDDGIILVQTYNFMKK